MKCPRTRAAALAALLCASAVAQAQATEAPLNPAELAQCAQQVQTLRHDAPRLNAQSERLEARRTQITARGEKLKADVAAGQTDQLHANLALRERRQQHNAEASAFNGEIAQFVREVNALNLLKDQYDRNCSTRPFRRNDLQALPPEARRAMQMGLSDVVVPYVEGRPSVPLAP